MARDEVELPITIASEIARVDGAVGFTRDGSCFADLATWPPVITRRAEYALDAARGPTGTWLVYARVDKTWSLRWYASIADTVPILDEKEPVPRRGFEPFTTDLDKTSKSIELAHVNRIESVHLCGELAVIVPRHVGLGELRHPYVKRDGRWRQEKKLPPFTKTTDKLSTRCATAGLRLGDGTDVLVWDGYVYASDGKKLSQRFEERLDLRWYYPYEPVASYSGLYACDGDALVELGPLGRQELLPGVKAASVHRGPDDTLLVATTGGELLLVSPREKWKAIIPEELIGRRYNIVGATRDGGLVAFGGPTYNLAHIPASELATLPRQNAAEPPVAVVVPPAPALDELGAASRPQLAGHGDALLIAHRGELRFHDEDRVDGCARFESEVVAVAHDGDHFAALFASGLLRELAGAKKRGKLYLVPEPPRSLAVGPGTSWLVLTGTRVWQIDLTPRAPKLVEITFPHALAAATDAAGTVLLAGEGARLATWSNGTLVDLPPALEQIIACVAVAPGRFICGGERHLFQLVVAGGELEMLEGEADEAFATAPTPHLAVSPNGKRFAWCTSPQAVRIAALNATRFEVEDNVQYPSSFSEPDEPLAVRGLAFLSDHQLAIGLDHGRGNIIDLAATSACKLDPHPGDARSRWIFFYGGHTLVAD
jgi:hypothetical protein